MTVTHSSRAAEPAAALPESWYGTWRGACFLVRPDGTDEEFPMELFVGPVDGEAAWTWRVTLGGGRRVQARDGRLVADPKTAGRFLLDERNGVLVDHVLIDGTLFGELEVAGGRVTSRFQLRGETLEVELASFRADQARRTQVFGNGVRVSSLPLKSLQRGVLIRQESRH